VAAGAHAHGSREAALAAFAPLASRLRLPGPERAARAVLDGALEKVELAVADASRTHGIGTEVPLVALGGAAEALVPELARRLGRPLVRPRHPEVLSSIGAAISLVRAELTRTPAPAGRRSNGGAQVARAPRLEIVHDAERACVEAGAAPGTVSVETSFDADEGILRAIATGAVALEAGAAGRRPLPATERCAAAARSLGRAPSELSLLAQGEFYAVYSVAADGGRVAVVDLLGGVPLAERARSVVVGEGDAFLGELAEAVEAATLNLGVASIVPRVSVLAGPRLLDLSDARAHADVLSAAERAIRDEAGPAVAVIAR
jgi:N-methylhydantoinase A